MTEMRYAYDYWHLTLASELVGIKIENYEIQRYVWEGDHSVTNMWNAAEITWW